MFNPKGLHKLEEMQQNFFHTKGGSKAFLEYILQKKAPPQTLSFVILLRDVFRTVKLLVADVTNPTTKNKILSEMVANHFP